MDYELIVAMSKNGVIGLNNKLPWHIPEDLRYFKAITMNSILIMGRKTFDSLPTGPLLHRVHIVITRNPSSYTSTERVKYCSPTDAINIVERERIIRQKVFVIGGAEIYSLFFQRCAKLHLTVIDAEVQGDTYFPYTFDELSKHGFSECNTSNVILSKTNDIQFQHLILCRDKKIV